METQLNQNEFYAPFAHIPGRYEFCRIHSPSHGSFDTFNYVQTTTDQPVCVYVCSENGQGFMNDRYPECRCVSVTSDKLGITSDQAGRKVQGHLEAEEGPVKSVELTLTAPADAKPVESPYSGQKFMVWGSKWSCTGMDLDLKAWVQGQIELADGKTEDIDESGILTLGSTGFIEKA